MKDCMAAIYEKWNTCLKRCRKQIGGTTLVELIVCFVVLLILVTAAVATLSPAANVFARVSGMGRAQSVSDILIEKIAGELGSATGNIYLSKDGSQIAYDDQTGHQVIMKVEESEGGIRRLLLHYQSVYSLDEEVTEKSVDWYFSDKTYMNNSISELSFTREGATSCIRIHLKLENIKSGYTYERDKIIECYKLENDAFKTDEFPAFQ